MTLSIIIVSYQTKKLISQCLKWLYVYRPAGEFEVIVVDNASSDGTADMIVKDFPQVRLFRMTENLGYPKGNNFYCFLTPTSPY